MIEPAGYEGKIKPYANLYGADLSWANLSWANLSWANLSWANLHGADLYGANLYGANLYGANLFGAGLYGADLSGANLSWANLSWANLSGANLSGANLYGAHLYGAHLSGAKNIPELAAIQTLIVPQDGQVTGWKKCMNGVIVKLLIPASAKRHNATGRKCRAEKAKVIGLYGAGSNVNDASIVAVPSHDPSIKYVYGKTVKAKNYEPDRWQECAGGIHFFITRLEAEEHT